MANYKRMECETAREESRKRNKNKDRPRKEYKNRKLNIGMEKYWEDKELKGKIKEIWAEMRCENVGKNIHKDFRETKCTLCEKEEETIAHIFECKEAEERIEWKLTSTQAMKRGIRGY